MTDAAGLNHYWFSKMKCAIHGKYVARTEDKAERPIPCPECVAGWELEESCRGFGKNPVPFVSKPRRPQDTKVEFIHSKKATLRKRSRPV